MFLFSASAAKTAHAARTWGTAACSPARLHIALQAALELRCGNCYNNGACRLLMGQGRLLAYAMMTIAAVMLSSD